MIVLVVVFPPKRFFCWGERTVFDLVERRKEAARSIRRLKLDLYGMETSPWFGVWPSGLLREGWELHHPYHVRKGLQGVCPRPTDRHRRRNWLCANCEKCRRAEQASRATVSTGQACAAKDHVRLTSKQVSAA